MKIEQTTNVSAVDRVIEWTQRPQIAFPIVALCIAGAPSTTNWWSMLGCLAGIIHFGYYFANGLILEIRAAKKP